MNKTSSTPVLSLNNFKNIKTGWMKNHIHLLVVPPVLRLTLHKYGTVNFVYAIRTLSPSSYICLGRATSRLHCEVYYFLGVVVIHVRVSYPYFLFIVFIVYLQNVVCMFQARMCRLQLLLSLLLGSPMDAYRSHSTNINCHFLHFNGGK